MAAVPTYNALCAARLSIAIVRSRTSLLCPDKRVLLADTLAVAQRKRLNTPPLTSLPV